jgi:hypothetical protein
MKTMIAAALGCALAVGVGGLALGADTPVIGVVPPVPAFARIAPAPRVQLAGHDKDEDEGLPEGEYYAPHGHEGHKGHGEESEEHHHEAHRKHHKDEKETERDYGGPFFRPAYTNYFHQCYEGVEVKSLPPGLQKQVERTGHLPPGLEKHLEREGTLPPGLQKRMSPANPCVLRHIGPLPAGSRLYMLGRDAYLINYHTRRILDILRSAY